ncbi:MAG: hypothetical protein KID00_15800, partial [Clostridium argentinense]|nr:hypothetical protein [Clostridium argentinense]
FCRYFLFWLRFMDFVTDPRGGNKLHPWGTARSPSGLPWGAVWFGAKTSDIVSILWREESQFQYCSMPQI